jgi:hypothetical protein
VSKFTAEYFEQLADGHEAANVFRRSQGRIDEADIYALASRQLRSAGEEIERLRDELDTCRAQRDTLQIAGITR